MPLAPIIKPPRLHPGDTVAIVSPSHAIAHRQVEFQQARRNFEQATGLKTLAAPNALAQHYYAAGTVKQRLDDFHWALTNPAVKGIIMSVGGSSAYDLVGELDYDLIRQNPKLIAGISDASTLQNPILAKAGLITFLGIEFMHFASQPMLYEVASIKQFWFGGTDGTIRPNPNWSDYTNEPTAYNGWLTIRPGLAEGRIIGGNYTSYEQLQGTGYAPDATGNILVMESYMYSKEKIGRAFAQLRLRGTLDRISGLIIGYNIGSDNPSIPGNDRSLKDLVLEATGGYTFPIMQIGEIGHCVENIMLPIGATARLDASNQTFEITKQATTEYQERSRDMRASTQKCIAK